MALLVCVLCQPVHSCIEPSLHMLDFFLEIFYEGLFLFFFDKNLLTIRYVVPPTIAVDASFSHVRTDEWLPTASTLCTLSLPHKKSANGKSQLCSKQSSNELSTEIFMAIGGCFELFMYLVTVLGWLKKEREKKMNDSDFRLFQVCHFK